MNVSHQADSNTKQKASTFMHPALSKKLKKRRIYSNQSNFHAHNRSMNSKTRSSSLYGRTTQDQQAYTKETESKELNKINKSLYEGTKNKHIHS